MSLEFQILGEPGRDNALLATIDSGHSVHRLLFDCGERCLSQLPVAQIAEIEAVFFSHFHMDHVAGFDSFVRVNWNRADKPVRVFGPPGTIDIIHHRLRGYIWNLAAGSPAEWLVSEISEGECHTVRLLSSEGFAQRHEVETLPHRGPIYFGGCFEVGALELDHGTPSMGYYVHEDDRSNVATERLSELGLRPGPWMQSLKDELGTADDAQVDVHGTMHRIGDLRAQLISKTAGDSIAYLTDFRIGSGAEGDRLVQFLEGCQTLVCENNYRNAEAELAAKHHHLTSAEVGQLAARIDPERLILFHLSQRYTEEDWLAQLEEVRAVFGRVEFRRDGWVHLRRRDSRGHFALLVLYSASP